MILYHGSEFIIEKPRYKGSKPYNDYGYGFYCTEYPDMAREWSVAADRNGYINRYELSMEDLNLLCLNDYPVITWLSVLLENRTFELTSPLAREAAGYIRREFSVDYGSYDVIRGYRADDSYFSFAQDFISGVISYEQLCKAMRLGELGDQIVLKSRKAFDKLTFLDASEVQKEIWYPAKEERDRKARHDYHSMDKISYVRGALYITGILDREMKRDDVRLR